MLTAVMSVRQLQCDGLVVLRVKCWRSVAQPQSVVPTLLGDASNKGRLFTPHTTEEVSNSL